MKFKYVSNIDWSGGEVRYLTIGKAYDFEMRDDHVGETSSDRGEAVFEYFPNPSHGQWEKVEE